MSDSSYLRLSPAPTSTFWADVLAFPDPNDVLALSRGAPLPSGTSLVWSEGFGAVLASSA